MKIVFSWDDGAKEDLKLFELHRKYSIPGMFFVPTRNKEGREVLSPIEIKENASKLISFGGHTENHSYLTDVDPKDLDYEIKENKDYLEGVLEESVKNFCLPGGKYDSNVLSHVFKYYETCRTAETMAFPDGSKLTRPTIHLYPRGKKSLVGNAIRHKQFGLAFSLLFKRFPDYFAFVEYMLERYKEKDVIISIWGHSWEIDELKWWDKLDCLFSLVSEKYKNCVASYSELFKQ